MEDSEKNTGRNNKTDFSVIDSESYEVDSNSSVVDSDSEYEDIPCDNNSEQCRSHMLVNNDNKSNNDVKANFEDVTVQGLTSSNIFGNVVYHGPITINQIIRDAEKMKIETRKDGSGLLNKIGIETNPVSDILTLSEWPLRIITREEWNAEPPVNEPPSLVLPAIRVIIAHTVHAFPRTEMECKVQARNIQDYCTDKLEFDDITYNFLIGGDGAVYVGRGWDKEGQHTKNYNGRSICIAFMGKFCRVTPEDRQLTAAKKLMEEGVKLGKLDRNYRLYGHRQLKDTLSPGSALYSIIITWDHWSEDILPP